MQECQITSDGYRYEVLLQAIDFFTQRFNLEQIGYYAFEFANEILTLNFSALFIREGNQFVMTQKRFYTIESYQISCRKALEEIPTLHGDIITSQFEIFFDERTVKGFDIKLVIPLIIDDYLYGFIISNGKILSELDNDDRVIASTLTKLFANSLGNSRQLEELKKKNKQLDQKIFNLFAINQSAKSLLSEVDLNKLYTLATDIFSEITCSKVTSFGIYDAVANTIKVLGYRNVSNYSTVFTELKISNHSYQNGRIVLDLKKDLEVIRGLFENWEEFNLLEARYIILLVKDKLLGIVTLSEPVNERIYDKETFELVETLASFTYIAISNALLFKELVSQRERIQRKYNILNTLNKIIQNINRGISIDEISSLTLKVLSVNFGIKKAFFAYKNESSYTVKHTLGLQVQYRTFTLNNYWQKVCEGEMILDFKEEAVSNFFDKDFISKVGPSNCIVIAPIGYEEDFLDNQTMPKGFLVVLETSDGLKEEEALLIDTITKNISPVIYQMELNLRMLEDYRIDPLRQFVAAVELKLAERKEYSLDFYLYYKKVEMAPFQNVEEFLIEEEACYLVNQYLFLLSYDDEIEDKTFCKMPYLESVEELKSFNYSKFYQQYVHSLI